MQPEGSLENSSNHQMCTILRKGFLVKIPLIQNSQCSI